MRKICLFVCFFGVFRPTREFFTHTETSPFQWRASNFDQCKAPMAIEQWEFFRCHIYCDTGHPFIMVISEDPWHSRLLRAFGSGDVTICFYEWGNRTLYLPHARRTLKPTAPPRRSIRKTYFEKKDIFWMLQTACNQSVFEGHTQLIWDFVQHFQAERR